MVFACVAGWGEVSGDRLARITDAIAFRREDPEGPQVVTLTTETAEALVEIAKAARDITESIAEAEGFRYVGSEDDIDALACALARLDSGAAEEDA
jgi:hypothetical protein